MRTIVTNGRADWSEVRDRVDMVRLATALMGAPPGRRGERSQRNQWWSCPFHPDKNPSFCIQVGSKGWRCFGCQEKGDAASLVMRLRDVEFPAAVEWLAEFCGVGPSSSRHPLACPRPRGASVLKSSGQASDRRSALSIDEAAALIDSASRRLWETAGREALAYLRNRGLEDDTIKRARLGWADKLRVPKKDGGGTWPLSGVVVPWLDAGRPALVKIRRLGFFRGSKYIELTRDHPVLYPDRDGIRPGCTAIVAEGEFDALLLAQEIGRLGVSVVTLGSASNRPTPEAIDLLCTASRLFIATHADDAGDSAASIWPAHARRARPPAGSKDWCEVHQGGRNRLRYLWPGILCGYDWPRARRTS
jgi:DNA primase